MKNLIKFTYNNKNNNSSNKKFNKYNKILIKIMQQQLIDRFIKQAAHQAKKTLKI